MTERVAYPVLRVVFGAVMLTHGLPKALGLSHGAMADPMAATRALIESSLHLPLAGVLAVAVTVLETAGALAVILGVRTRIVSAAFAIEMTVVCFIHGPTFAWIDRGFEYPLVLGVVALYLAAGGSGAYAIDNRGPR